MIGIFADYPVPTRRALGAAGSSLLALSFSSCGGVQSALNPAGPQAARIAGLWWFLFAVCAAIFISVIGFLLYAASESHKRASAAKNIYGKPNPLVSAPGQDRERSRESRMRTGVIAAGVVTALILLVFLTVSVWNGSRLAALARPDSLTIEVIGHQWWWEVHYQDPDPERQVTTANEIHLPVGRPVLLQTTSVDVIHSFWAPNLHGKKDLIPGRLNTAWLEVDRPGVFRGQCAEFCGFQHAHMAFVVVAEPPESFSAWLETQRQPAAEPSDAEAARGRQVFLSSTCVLCHTIRGTGAFGSVAPDLTHLASRRTIAAGMLPNTIGNLGGWILDPQTVKPGTRMPATPISPEDLEPLLSYLHALK